MKQSKGRNPVSNTNETKQASKQASKQRQVQQGKAKHLASQAKQQRKEQKLPEAKTGKETSKVNKRAGVANNQARVVLCSVFWSGCLTPSMAPDEEDNDSGKETKNQAKQTKQNRH